MKDSKRKSVNLNMFGFCWDMNHKMKLKIYE